MNSREYCRINVSVGTLRTLKRINSARAVWETLLYAVSGILGWYTR